MSAHAHCTVIISMPTGHVRSTYINTVSINTLLQNSMMVLGAVIFLLLMFEAELTEVIFKPSRFLLIIMAHLCDQLNTFVKSVWGNLLTSCRIPEHLNSC